jgi:hypothetical protein
MRVALLLLLLASPRSWACLSVPDLLERATIVVAGEVVSIKDDANRPVARLKVRHVLKGKPDGDEIDLPFKLECTWACDFTISYQKGEKYLLLLDDRQPFRVVYYPSRTHDRIQSYDGHEVTFANLALKVMEGDDLSRRLPQLLKMAAPSWWDWCDVVRRVPRSSLRPYLAEVRTAYAPTLARRPSRTSKEWERYRHFMIQVDLEVTRDLSEVSDLLDDGPLEEASLRRTLSLVTGMPVWSLDAFKKSWATALRRAAAKGNPDDVAAHLEGLASIDAGERDKAFQRILDLGPDALKAVKARLDAEDLEIRSRVAELVRELELLEDLRADLARRR